MSEENVAIVRKTAENFNALMRGEMPIETWVRVFDPEIEIHWHGGQTYPDAPQRVQGTQDLVAFTEEYRDGWADFAEELLELTETPGERVFTFVRQTARGRQSGVPIEIHYFQLWTFRDGKVHEIEYFRHRADALRAAGLRE